MLTETDQRVRAEVNLHAVLGSLPRLVELAPEAQTILRSLDGPVALAFRGPGGLGLDLTFHRDRIEAGHAQPSSRAGLIFRSAAHLNSVVDGTAKPIPVGGPRGLRFLMTVFEPLSALLGTYLEPTPAHLSDPARAEATALMTLHVAATAITVVGNTDRSGRFSVSQMPQGDIAIEVGDQISYRIAVSGSRLALVPEPKGAPRAALTFSTLDVVGGVLSGKYSAVACIGDGRMTMRGMIPLVDNTSRILDRVGAYLGK